MFRVFRFFGVSFSEGQFRFGCLGVQGIQVFRAEGLRVEGASGPGVRCVQEFSVSKTPNVGSFPQTLNAKTCTKP